MSSSISKILMLRNSASSISFLIVSIAHTLSISSFNSSRTPCFSSAIDLILLSHCIDFSSNSVSSCIKPSASFINFVITPRVPPRLARRRSRVSLILLLRFGDCAPRWAPCHERRNFHFCRTTSLLYSKHIYTCSQSFLD